MATLPAGCPAPPANSVVQLPGNLSASVSATVEYFPITITAAGALVNPAGIAGNATARLGKVTTEAA